MYANSDYVTSELITGTQWDVMLNKFIGKRNQNNITLTLEDMLNSKRWGNYKDNNLLYTGRHADMFLNTYWYIKPWEVKTENATTSTYTAYTTGASKQTEMYHTYDIAGNVWEWTDEVGKGVNYGVARGGAGYNESEIAAACYRQGVDPASHLWMTYCFRVVLYIK